MSTLDKTAVFGHVLNQDDAPPLVLKYVEELFVAWRSMTTDTLPLFQLVGLNQYTRMGPDVMSEVFSRKAARLRTSDRALLDDRHRLDEFYLVLGGDPDAPQHSKQRAGDHAFMLHSLQHMTFVLKDIGFDGVVVFYDPGDMSVLCTGCLQNEQAANNWRAREARLSKRQHECAWLTIDPVTIRNPTP